MGVRDQEGVGGGTLGNLSLDHSGTVSESGARAEWDAEAGDSSVRRR